MSVSLSCSFTHLVRQLKLLVISMTIAILCGCGSDIRPKMEWQSNQFFEFPWPNTIRKKHDGSLDLDLFPASQRHPIARQIINIGAQATFDFGTNAAVYFQFSGALDTNIETSNLPSVTSSTESDALVMLVNVSPSSDRYLERIPLRLDFKSLSTLYRPGNLLTLLPLGGFSLAPNSDYAAIVFKHVRTASGNPIQKAALIQSLQQEEKPGDMDNNAWEEISLQWSIVSDYVNTHTDHIADDIAAFTLYRTQAPTHVAYAIKRALAQFTTDDLISSITELSLHKRCPDFAEYRGQIELPIWQQGQAPYLLAGGHVALNNGIALQNGSLSTPISLVIGCKSNQSARKVIVRAGGTGASFTSARLIPGSFFPNGEFNQIAVSVAPHHSSQRRHANMDGFANLVSSLGVPVDETELEGLAYYNFLNPVASNGNHQQGAADHVFLKQVTVHLQEIFDQHDIDVRNAGLPEDALTINPNQAALAGQSQGGGNGPIAMAMDESFTIGLFNGASSHAYPQALHRGTVRELINALLFGITASELDEFHPVMQVIQTFHEPADSTNYVHDIQNRDLLMTAGYYDGCVAREGAGALGFAFAKAGSMALGETATGLPEFSKIHEYLELATTPLPLANGNIITPDGQQKIGLFLEIAAGHGGTGSEATAAAFLAKTTGSLPDIDIPMPAVPVTYWPCDDRYD